MRKLLTPALFGAAGLLWSVGLGLAFRTDTGVLVISICGGILAWRFGPALAQGRVREELAKAVPNVWMRRYWALVGFCVFAIPGILSVCGQWNSTQPYRGYAYPTAGNLTDGWGVVFVLSLLLPAILLAIWAQSTRSETAQPKATQ